MLIICIQIKSAWNCYTHQTTTIYSDDQTNWLWPNTLIVELILVAFHDVRAFVTTLPYRVVARSFKEGLLRWKAVRPPRTDKLVCSCFWLHVMRTKVYWTILRWHQSGRCWWNGQFLAKVWTDVSEMRRNFETSRWTRVKKNNWKTFRVYETAIEQTWKEPLRKAVKYLPNPSLHRKVCVNSKLMCFFAFRGWLFLSLSRFHYLIVVCVYWSFYLSRFASL